MYSEDMDEDHHLYATLSYIPLLGPLLVYSFYRESPFARHHAKNAFLLQTAFAAALLLTWLLTNLPGISTILRLTLFVPFVTNAMLYLAVVALLTLSLTGSWKAYRGKEWRVPFLFDFIEKTILKKKDTDNKDTHHDKKKQSDT